MFMPGQMTSSLSLRWIRAPHKGSIGVHVSFRERQDPSNLEPGVSMTLKKWCHYPKLRNGTWTHFFKGHGDSRKNHPKVPSHAPVDVKHLQSQQGMPCTYATAAQPGTYLSSRGKTLGNEV